MPALKSTSRKSVWPPHPPPNESEEATRMRMEEEAEAKRVSESIDRALLAERELLKKRHSGAKILLLGMSSSPSFTSLYSFFNFFLLFFRSGGIRKINSVEELSAPFLPESVRSRGALSFSELNALVYTARLGYRMVSGHSPQPCSLGQLYFESPQ